MRSGKFLLAAIFSLFLLSTEVSAQVDVQLVEIADEMYNFGDVKDALDIYKQALEMNPDNIRANLMAGKCYLESTNKEQSLPYLLKAYQLDANVAPNILFMIATSYHLGNKFDEATDFYNKYKNEINNRPLDEQFTDVNKAAELRKIDRRIEECRNGKIYVASPVKTKIENISDKVNSEFGDYAPVLSADEKSLFFTSRRTGSTGANKDNDNEFFEDIWYSKNSDSTGGWSTPVNAGPIINTVLHEATVALSPDGTELFIYVDNDNYPGDIFHAHNKKGEWTKPQPFLPVNTEFIENSICMSKNGKVILFSSNRPGGQGGKDIYMIKKQKDGEWGLPTNLGNKINTEYDDEGPFLDIDGKTLYFTSKGHKGMGGFDIYKSVYDSTAKAWGDPVNLGYPINSADDDIYFQMGAKSRIAYYASAKSNGKGDLDIYSIILPEYMTDEPIDSVPPKDTVVVVKNVQKKGVMLNIKVIDENNNPIDAEIEIWDNTTSKTVYDGKTVQASFVYPFNNTTLNKYTVTGSKPGYMFHTSVVYIPAVTETDQQVTEIIKLHPIKVGEITILKNIYYDFDKSNLKEESFDELNKVVKMMKENPNMKIEISSHTDSEGSHEYNMALSKKRAESCMRYLMSKGIAKERLVPKGYGETVPLASNDDEEEGRELNRRTEIKILAK